jgi:phosphonate degradation associated HDIG domain protein
MAPHRGGPAVDGGAAVDEVVALFALRGAEHHGEVVDQRAHALQCAELARADGAPDHLVAAALLHDIGHLVASDGGSRGDLHVDDDHHEAVGARWVAARFGAAAARPVALHVVAKRYRCTVDPAYTASLSPTSVVTLEVQGGRLTGAEVVRFAAQPGHHDAVRLREWDEQAKAPGRTTVGLDEFLPVLRRLVASAADRRA